MTVRTPVRGADDDPDERDDQSEPGIGDQCFGRPFDDRARRFAIGGFQRRGPAAGISWLTPFSYSASGREARKSTTLKASLQRTRRKPLKGAHYCPIRRELCEPSLHRFRRGGTWRRSIRRPVKAQRVDARAPTIKGAPHEISPCCVDAWRYASAARLGRGSRPRDSRGVAQLLREVVTAIDTVA